MIARIGTDGELLSQRQSLRRGSEFDVCTEFFNFPSLVNDAGFEPQLVLTNEDEYPKHDPNEACLRHG